MPKIVGIPLQFHFLEPKILSRRFPAYRETKLSEIEEVLKAPIVWINV